MMLSSRSTEVRHQIVNVHRIPLESSARREMEVSDDLVDVKLSSYVATFLVLSSNLFRPMLGDTLRKKRSDRKTKR